MSEQGGATTQSGILYQNSVAALYLGRLCDFTQRLPKDTVTGVRCEAPEHVDDIVVTHQDSHRDFIQVKEDVRRGGEAWVKLWHDFAKQYWSDTFSKEIDRLLLHVGDAREEFRNLKAICERARSSQNYPEWYGRVTNEQKRLLSSLIPLLPSDHREEAEQLEFFSHVFVEVWPGEMIERDLLPFWIPQTNKTQRELFHLLRDRAGRYARERIPVTAEDLRESLRSEEDVHFEPTTPVSDLIRAVHDCGALLRIHKNSIADTDIHVERSVVEQITNWATANSTGNLAFLLDVAGMGKTVVIRDVLDSLESAGITVLAIKADQQLSGITSINEIQEKLQLPESVERVVQRLTSLGRVVVLIDQIDALSLSMARSRRTLDLVIDLIARLRLLTNVRILISCRLFDKRNDPRLNQIETTREFTLPPFSEEDVTNALTEVGIDYSLLSPVTQQLLRVPLHLNLFVLATREQPAQRQNVASLQDLYRLLWSNIVEAPLPDGPNSAERAAAISVLTEYMDSRQTTSAPRSIFERVENIHLKASADYLESAGLLKRGVADWSFLHQTFFDYSYARQFLLRGESLSKKILNGPQGLFARPQLINVLDYLRGADYGSYLRELRTLLFAKDLRPHLRDLLVRWFGTLRYPSEEEWNIARQLLVSDTLKPKFFLAASGNAGWFRHIHGQYLEHLFQQNDQTIDSLLIPYLASIIEAKQAEVIGAILPHVGSSDQWKLRLSRLLRGIQTWNTVEALDLFEKVFRELPGRERQFLYRLEEIAEADPPRGCRLIRILLDRIVDNVLSDVTSNTRKYFSLSTALEELNGTALDETLKITSRAEPQIFIESLLPWVERVVGLREERPDEAQYFGSDEFSFGWHERIYVTKRRLIESIVSALALLAQDRVEVFRQAAARLAELPYQTPQILLAQAYRSSAEVLAEDAFQFIMLDRRRLDLGEHEQFESRQLISAIYPFLTDSQRISLEGVILSHAPVFKGTGIAGLRYRGLNQLYLLQAIPPQYLTERGLRYLREMERKFPGVRASNTPITMQGGVVGSPVSAEATARMSDRAWLLAMRHYQGGVTHKDFLKGGAQQLAGELVTQLKLNPERFYRMAMEQVPDDIDKSYVHAFINGLADSDAPPEFLFNVVRRFAPQAGHDIKRSIGGAVRRRVEQGVPDDILDLLEGYVRGPMQEDEEEWARRNGRNEAQASDGLNHGPYSSYINSMRGSALEASMLALRQRHSPLSTQRRWELIEWIATEPSASLRAGAIEHLLFLIDDDRERAINLFEQLMDGHSVLIRSYYTLEFLFYGIYRFFSRVRPYIHAAIDDEAEYCQQRGAELACLAAISPNVYVEPGESADVSELVSKFFTGPPPWRRGAARVYAHNAAGASSDVCFQGLLRFLHDEDEQVRRFASGVFGFLGDPHIISRRTFIENFVSSPSLHEGFRDFTDYFSRRAFFDLEWSLKIVELILANQHPVDAENTWDDYGEPLVRLVVSVYDNPASNNEVREEAMRLFDILAMRYSGETNKVLGEWDRS